MIENLSSAELFRRYLHTLKETNLISVPDQNTQDQQPDNLIKYFKEINSLKDYSLISKIENLNIKPKFYNLKEELSNISLKNEIYKEKLINIYSYKTVDLPSLFSNLNPSKLLPQVQVNYNPQMTSINFNTLPLPGLTVDTKTTITAENIAEFAFPLAQFIEQVRPDYIIACDRGARIIAMAVHMLYQRLYGGLPTQDHLISFRKISRKAPEEMVRETIKTEVERMLAQTESPTVLVLDDWVASGGTKNLVQNLFAELSGGKVNLLYGVMRGSGADITGKQDSASLGDWHDRAEIIGVDYTSRDLTPYIVDSEEARDYRRKMSRAINQFLDQFDAKAA